MSSNKYVPPHMRNKPQVQEEERKPRYQNTRRYEKPRWQVLEEEEEIKRKQKQEQGMEDNDQNFPSLSTSVVKTAFVKKSFAEIALAGHEKSEQEATKKSIEEKYRTERFNVPLPIFHNVRNFVEPEDDGSMDEPKTHQTQDDWITVDRKKHRNKKTIEEIVKEDEQEQLNEENTVWSEQLEEHQTCWDERY
jgi:hypothetical protein